MKNRSNEIHIRRESPVVEFNNCSLFFFFRSFKARSLQRQCMFEASDRMNHLKKPKPRGQTLPPHAYNMDFSSSMRSNLSNFNSPQHLDDKIEEDQEDPNAGIELLERSDITNDEPVVEGKL